MIVGRVQSVGVSGSTVTSLAPVFTTPNQAGNMIIVAFTDNQTTTNSITSITDTNGNSYARVLSNNDGAASQFDDLDVWYAYNIKAGANTVTINFSSATGAALVAEYTGVTRTDPLDVSASAAGVSSPDSSGNTATTNQAKEIVIGFIGTNSALWSSYNLGAGFTNLATRATGASRPVVGLEHKLVDTVGAQSATFTVAGAATAVIVGVATFKLATAGFNTNNLHPHPFSPGLAR